MNTTVLLIATESYAGMGPYVVSIINSFKPDDDVCFLVVEDSNNYFHKNIRPELHSLTNFIPFKPKRLYKKIYELLVDHHRDPIANQIENFVKNGNFKVIHSLNSLTNINLVKSLKQQAPLLYTIHDFYHHEVKKKWYKLLRQKILNRRVLKARNLTDLWITNSLSQLNDQKRLFPNKSHYYFSFPTLITDIIANGNEKIPELETINRYILFFGRIEAYKGIEYLIRAFKRANLNEDVKLVIAGKGELNYSSKDEQIVYLNRYIKDEEIAHLYKNASCIVYPYISATQSGVLSLATYFNKPILSSNIPFFREILGSDYIGFFEPSNVDSLTKKIESFFIEENSFNANNFSLEIYNKVYSGNAIRDQLLNVYHKI